MKKNSTPVPIKKSSNSTAELHARQSTLNAIMQFARSYTYVPKLQAGLGNMVANWCHSAEEEQPIYSPQEYLGIFLPQYQGARGKKGWATCVWLNPMEW